MKIWAHTIVKNEDRYVWFSIMSVIEHVDKILVYDTGSTDNTVKIIQEIKKKYPAKVIIKEVGNVDVYGFTRVRQEMLEATCADWFLILDADEIWWEEGIVKLIETINENPKLESVVSMYYSLAGDIYHYQDESFGKYQIDQYRGHINIRAMSMKIPGINFQKPHGQLGVYDSEGRLVQQRDRQLRLCVEEPGYLHFTNLRRSSEGDSLVPKRAIKYRHLLGKPFPFDFYYPEVLFIERPGVVLSPWVRRNWAYELRALAESPLRRVKRMMKILDREGY